MGQTSDFHVFHKEVNALHTSACEYAWTRVAPRCVQVAHGMPPQYVDVSFPWAKLLPLACDQLDVWGAHCALHPLDRKLGVATELGNNSTSVFEYAVFHADFIALHAVSFLRPYDLGSKK